jgi:hypothetical protein
VISSFGGIAHEPWGAYKVRRLFLVAEMFSLLGRESTGVVDKEKEQEWIEKYREAMIRAMPGQGSRLERAFRAGARILAALFRKSSNRRANTAPRNLAKKSLSEPPSPEQQQKKAG